MGYGKDDCKLMRILNRIVTLEEDRVLYEPDRRHAEIIVKQMGLQHSSRGADSPNVKREALKDFEEDNYLSEQESMMYRAMVARANYLAMDKAT